MKKREIANNREKLIPRELRGTGDEFEGMKFCETGKKEKIRGNELITAIGKTEIFEV